MKKRAILLIAGLMFIVSCEDSSSNSGNTIKEKPDNVETEVVDELIEQFDADIDKVDEDETADADNENPKKALKAVFISTGGGKVTGTSHKGVVSLGGFAPSGEAKGTNHRLKLTIGANK